jgi:aminoglycoside phosphotransferase (APT) family kinase protein
VAIDVPLVRRLLRQQHPDLARLLIRPVEAGWDNAMFRLGDHFAVRLPRRAAAAELVMHEQRWLPTFADRLPLPAPAPLRTGVPGAGYPWHWSVVPWLAGVPADLVGPRPDQATTLGRFLHALHTPAPDHAPRNPFRGGPLSDRAAALEERMDRLSGHTPYITDVVRRAWDQALAAPTDVEPTWIHGDLHPRNILVDRGRLSAVIDWGDVTRGDPATDLAAMWMLFPARAHRHAVAAYGPMSPATLRRARGWAVFFGVVLIDTGLVDDSRFAAVGRRTLSRIESWAEPAR